MQTNERGAMDMYFEANAANKIMDNLMTKEWISKFITRQKTFIIPSVGKDGKKYRMRNFVFTGGIMTLKM